MLNFSRSGKHARKSEAELPLQVGDTLQLRFSRDDKHKYHSQLIGYLPKKSLLITAPRREGKILNIKSGQSVAVRLLSGDGVLGFNTTVMSQVRDPYPYLHLEYPFSTGKIMLRKSHRIHSKLIVSVQMDNTNGNHKLVPAATYDLSTCGALIESPEELGHEGDLLTLVMRVNLGAEKEYLTLPAVIRHARFDKNPETGRSQFFHGVEFQIMEQSDSILLSGFVYQKMMGQ